MKSEKDECTTLIQDLAALRLQLKEAESQIALLESTTHYTENKHVIDANVNTPDTQFDLGDMSSDAANSVLRSPMTFQSDKKAFIGAVSSWIKESEQKQYHSGALVICTFLPREGDEGNSRNVQQGINDHSNRFDSIVNAVTQVGDVVAKLSQYERMFFLPSDVDGESAARAAKRIIKYVDEYDWSSQELNISYQCSVGIALYPSDAGDADTLFRFADRALYTSLKIDGSYYSFYI